MNDLLVVVFALGVLYKSCPVKRIDGFNEDYLSIQSCKNYKGIFAVIVLFNHISQQLQGGVHI